MATLSISGLSIKDYVPFFSDGGLLPSGTLATNAVASGNLQDDAVVAAKLNYQKVTGVASAGTPASAAHTLGAVPSLVIPTCRTSGGSIATTGTHTSAAILGIVSNVEAGATFEIYVFA